jgi:hypothetical protein
MQIPRSPHPLLEVMVTLSVAKRNPSMYFATLQVPHICLPLADVGSTILHPERRE